MAFGVDELRRRLGYHPAGPATAPVFELNRAATLVLAGLWDQVLPPGREAACAQTALQEALMWANAAVACNADPDTFEVPEVELGDDLETLYERLEGPTMRRSDPPAPPGGSDRPRRRDDEGITLPPGGRPPLGLSPFAAREGDQLAARRREHEGADDL